MPTAKLTPEIITAAIEGFEDQKRQIDGRLAELRAMLPGGSIEPTAAPEAPGRKRRKVSAAARKRMKEAQLRRWAKVRGESGPSALPNAEPEKPNRRISEEGMKRIIAAAKKRWRLQKAEAAKAKKAAPARKTTAGKTTAVKGAQSKAAKKAPVKKAA